MTLKLGHTVCAGVLSPLCTYFTHDSKLRGRAASLSLLEVVVYIMPFTRECVCVAPRGACLSKACVVRELLRSAQHSDVCAIQGHCGTVHTMMQCPTLRYILFYYALAIARCSIHPHTHTHTYIRAHTRTHTIFRVVLAYYTIEHPLSRDAQPVPCCLRRLERLGADEVVVAGSCPGGGCRGGSPWGGDPSDPEDPWDPRDPGDPGDPPEEPRGTSELT